MVRRILFSYPIQLCQLLVVSNTANELVGISNLAITATSATPACNALATGTINVTYTGGIGTIFYSLNGGAFVAAPAGNPFTITGLVGSGSPYTIQLMYQLCQLHVHRTPLIN